MIKENKNSDITIPNALVETGVAKMIQVIRNKQVLLDRDLATLYGVETKRINEQVKRNIERFPEDFCFQLTHSEAFEISNQPENLKSQIATSSWGGRRKQPFAFTEQGVAMLSAVLHSPTAVKVSIEIMKAFVSMRHYLMENGGFINRLSNIETTLLDQNSRISAQESHLINHDHKLDEIFEAMDRGELKAKGLFYNNQEFDAYVFVCGLIRQAKKKIILVDNYVNEKTLAMMLKRNKGVSVTIYTYDKSKVFEVDLTAYNAQYAECPIEILPSYGVHDRFLFIDDTAYHFGASLQDLGKKTFFFSKEDFTLNEVLKK